MSDNDNVTEIHRGARVTPIAPGTRPEEVDPDWLKAANSVSADFEEEPGEAAALDPSIPTRFDPVADAEVAIPGLSESVELAKTARQPEGNESIRQVLEEARPQDGFFQEQASPMFGQEIEPGPREVSGRPAKTRALTAIERAEQEAEAERRQIALDKEMADLRFEAEIDSKRVKPMSADNRPIQWTVLLGVVLIGAAAFAISYGAVYEVAGWTGWAQWQMILTPLLFDAGIIVFTFLSFIRMERGESALSTFLLAEALTVASAVAQVIHTLGTSPRTGMELAVACVISALPPLILSASSYLAGRTIFRKRARS